LIEKLLSADVQAFITSHYNDDPNTLLLKYKSINGVPISFIIDQIRGRKKAEDKLPSWHKNKRIVYPPAKNIEQSSSETTASKKIDFLKQELGGDLSNKRLLDLTGGFGVDSFYFSKFFNEVFLVEPDAYLLEICQHNHSVLNVSNVSYFNITAEQFLSEHSTEQFDVIFIDPSRRSPQNQKVFSFNKSQPDVVALQELLWSRGQYLFIKASPLLDIQLGLNELKFVKTVYVTSFHNECKEVLFFCQNNFVSEPIIVCINIDNREWTFSFKMSDERNSGIEFGDPLEFVYEPNASILKGGAFRLPGSSFNLYKIHPNTHLFTSSQLIDDFPGRVFRIVISVKPDPKNLREIFADGKANILARNYPLGVDALRKKTRLKDGGEMFLIACTGMHQKFLLVARRIK
jgi:16S rRNA G966 N2-methylase RsmD